jgi:adenine-specific DNA-methyltransferase
MIEPLTPDDAEAKSADVVASKIELLTQMFPEAIAEGKVDFDTLRQILGDDVDDVDEKFGLNWHGKRQARQLALTPSTGTLRPCPEDSVNWDTTQNLMIEGDNLEVLKLLQKSYAGKVKLIYIDPPYNTGKDFVYKDNYRDNIKNYLDVTGQTDEEGAKVSSNTEASGRYHTDWLNMMYPRLMLARELLAEDGVIFISIDDAEVAHLRMLIDEVFGDSLFAGNIVWQKKYSVSNDDPGIGKMHDHILAATRSSAFARGLLPRTESHNARYKNTDDDPRGPWTSGEYVSGKSKEERPTLWYSITHPRTGDEVWPEQHAVWRYSVEKHLELEADNRLYWGPNESYERPRLKRFLSEVQQGVVPSTWWPFQDVGHNDEAQKETVQLLEPKVFATPKPTRLIKQILLVGGVSEEDIVLDFFSGSGTTGHAVMAQNAEDGGARRYILVQLPEQVSPAVAGQNAAAAFCDELGVPRNIAELTKERLRRAGKKVAEEHSDYKGDLGFRAFKLDSSNIRTWDPHPDDLAATLEEAADHVKPDRSNDDVLYEILLKLGIDLCVPIETRDIAGKTVQSVGGGALIACLTDTITTDDAEPLAAGIAQWHKELAPAGDTTCIFRDNAFQNDVAKTNLAAILEQHGITTTRSI